MELEARYSLPPGVRVYAIGDVHGQLILLESLLAAIDEDLAQHPVDTAYEVMLGDYIDRGPDSRGVLQLLSGRPPAGRERICLRGNHEAYMLRFMENPAVLHDWAANGGLATLSSYGVHANPSALDVSRTHQEFMEALPDAHATFLEAMPASYQIGEVFFAHAGIRPGVPLDEQDTVDLMTIRRPFLSYAESHPARIVHGHTPVKEPTVTPYRINVDTGAFASGMLTCCVLEGDDERFIATCP